MSTKVTADDCPIIALDRFIQATRDSGYKGTSSAVSELIDNSLQAQAREIQVLLAEVGGDFPVDVKVLDNGCGMDPFTLRQALRFGGSSRFGDRNGLGRYGMGLPNSSLSQASRVTVYTWQKLEERNGKGKSKRTTPDEVYSSYLDVDEIASGALSQVPVPHKPERVPLECVGKSGTLVHWERCDRLDNRRISTLAKKLSADLGRRFRHYIWEGVRIEINGEVVRAADPLFVRGDRAGAELFGEELKYEIAIDPTDKSKGTSIVRVRFSELPVHEWQALSNEEKRDMGITKGAGVSIVRAGREVDYGWFFLDKRRENYDDWWRCEVRFEPALDEAFGITHTKQQARPRAYLLDALTPDIEETARILNGRARKSHLDTKAQERFDDVEKLAGDRDRRLTPLPAKGDASSQKLFGELKKKNPSLRAKKTTSGTGYKIVERSLEGMQFYKPAYDGERLVLVINPEHPFYKRLYGRLVESDKPDDKAMRERLELFLLAAARAEVALGKKNQEVIEKFRSEWSNALSTFLDT